MSPDPNRQVKVEIFIPAEFVEALRKAVASAGAGRIGNYDHCSTVMDVRGDWRPLEDARPFAGEVGRIEEGTECKVEVNCPYDRVNDVLAAIREVHPYEQPVVNLIALINDQFPATGLFH